jgi:predicted dehydrogenase
MAIDLTPEQRATGKANFNRTADGLSRRGFMKSLAVAGASVAVATPAMYFGYKSIEGKPVKAVLIGGGDEGGVLVGEHNPHYLEFLAVCDIRPSNMKRIFDGDPKVALRKGLKKVYGNRAGNIKQLESYDVFLEELRNNKEIEAVVIALPLCMHAKAAIDAMNIGKDRGKPIHVLTEKLMAWNIKQCKQMIRTAKKTGSILSVGHQRHYSMLYAHATDVVNAGILGDIRHIRALWHRNFSWPFDPKSAPDMVTEVTPPFYRDGWFPPITHQDYDSLADKKDMLKKFGFDNVEQLIRWRLYQATGGGLMAELGSHQLDACSIFLGHVHPLAVSGVGVRSFFGPGRNDRDIDDHVFATYEFPGKKYDKKRNPDDKVIVTYSSISTNGFENYGECVMGTRGTLIVEKEESVMLFPENQPGKVKTPPRGTEVGVSPAGKGEPVLESGSTWGGPTASVTGTSVGPGGRVSRGYTEEMEDFAYCVRQWDAKLGYAKGPDGEYKQRLTRCHGEIAMVDAIVALTANYAMQKQKRVEFQDDWFDADKPDVPPSDQPAKVEVA